jgi:hypothetical protein
MSSIFSLRSGNGGFRFPADVGRGGGERPLGPLRSENLPHARVARHLIRVQHAVKNTLAHSYAFGRNGSTRNPLRPCFFGDKYVDCAWRGCVSMGMPR